MLNKILPSFFFLLFSGCASGNYEKTVSSVDLDRFMKKWYVIAGRFTWMEEGAHNAVEEYKFNNKEQRIDINFYFNKDSFTGAVKKIPQKAWVENKKTNAHWKVSPFWPLKFDYIVIALADDYSWTAIGVPNEKYLWIMSDRWELTDKELGGILSKIKSAGYPVNDIVRIPQKWKEGE
jgi:apolipoprotein D and lipocalin family protein